MFSPIFGQLEQTSSAQSIIDKIARTPQSTIVLIVAALTLLRLFVFLFQRGLLIESGSAEEGAVTYRSGLGAVADKIGFGIAKTLFFWAKSKPGNFNPARVKAQMALNSVLGVVNESLDAVIYAGIFVFLLIRPYIIQAFVVPSGSMISTLHVGDYILANKFIYRFTDPKEGDIVVFIPPKAGTTAAEQDPDGTVNVDYVKRCIGVPGDVIELRNNILYRNGVAVDEPYAHFFRLGDQMGSTFQQIPNSDDQRCPPDFKFVNYKGKTIPLQIEGSLVNADPTYTAPIYGVNSITTMSTLKSLPAAPIPPGYYFMMGDDRNNSYDGRAWGLVPRNRIVGRADYIWFPLPRIQRLKSETGTAMGSH